MFRRTLIIFILPMAMIACPMAAAKEPPSSKCLAVAQKQKSKTLSNHSSKHVIKNNKHELKTKVNIEVDTQAATTEPTGRVSIALERGGKIVVSAVQGRIIITGSQGNMIEARATSTFGPEPVPLRVGRDEARSRITLSLPAHSEAALEIKIPRYAEVELVGGNREADIEVSDVDATVSIGSGQGRVVASRVGPLKVSRTNGDIVANGVKGSLLVNSISGDVEAQNIEGLADVVATSGDVTVRNAQSDVRVNSASGDIDTYCVKGRVYLETASGDIDLVGVGGDIDATTTSGDVDYRGRVRANGRYALKSHSGEVKMVIQPDAPGFTATLTSYSGEIETAFPLKLDSTLHGRVVNRRVTGRFGDGQAQLQLDSFSGGVRILKGATEPAAECK